MNLPSQYQEFIHLDHYARFNWSKGVREQWPDSLERLHNFLCESFPEEVVPRKYITKALHAVEQLHVMPSMRLLMTAGEPARQDNTCIYNCAYLAIDQPYKFAEVMHCLMNGVGVGFSVERQYIRQLPEIPDEIYSSGTTIIVEDSKLGWCTALRELISLLYSGQIPRWDTTRVRPAGSPLRTFGGRASGPGPLEELFAFCCETFRKAKGRTLTSIECHDIICKTGDVVVAGGVRRSALISLSNLSDDRMRLAKSGDWRTHTRWRECANNSAVYTDRPEMEIFFSEWQSLMASKSGERGIYNVSAAKKQAARYGRRDPDHHFGTNPCCEIILRDRQFCNLTEAVIRPDDTFASLVEKVELATFLGTLQSTFTDFRFLSQTWTRNCNEERLLGVSLTGIMDNLYTAGKLTHVPIAWTEHPDWTGDQSLPSLLRSLRLVAVRANAYWASRLGIPQSAAITCVKPSGTVSQLANCSAGIHPAYGKTYIRRKRINKTSPLYGFAVDSGLDVEDAVGSESTVAVISFPMRGSPEAILREQTTALDQLSLWMTYATHWCEHKPSCSVYVRDHEWMEVGAWVYRNFDSVSGLSFFPYDETSSLYKQLPYEEITNQEYEKMLARTPQLDFNLLMKYETTDQTTSSQELACVGGQCNVE